MYELDIWHLNRDNATRPVERVAEMRQPIQMSNFLLHLIHWVEFDTAEIGDVCSGRA